MIHQKDPLWTRIGHWMNPFQRDDTLPELARMPVNGAAGKQPSAAQEPAAGPAVEIPRRVMPWRRREEVIDRLQQGYDTVLELVESIQGHLSRQNQRNDQVTELLAEMTNGLREVPQAARQQAESVGQLASQMAISNRHSQTIISTLDDLPRSAAAQRQALDSIATQLGSSSCATEKLTERLDSIGGLVERLGDALQEQVRTLKAVQLATRHQESQIISIHQAQNRRFNILMAVVAVTAVAAAGCVFVWVQG